MKCPLGHAAVTGNPNGYPVFLSQLEGKRDTRGDRNPATDDGNGRRHTFRYVADMHGASPALAAPRSFTQQFINKCLQRDFFGQGMRMGAVGAGDHVFRTQGPAQADRHSLLPQY